ncbi:MAG: hypothetical protein IPN79_01025 [Saprospiraceae bacterium]|nr:hypothetical protein [Saprospiraceae bacterium]
MLRYSSSFCRYLLFIPRPETISSGQAGLYVTLEDGSPVWLDKNSSLTLHKFSDKSRKVELKEELFDMVKNDKAPFSI